MDGLAPDLHIVWQMFSMLVGVYMIYVCDNVRVYSVLYACTRAGWSTHPSIHPAVGIQVAQAPGATTDLGLLMLLISSRLFACGCSALRLHIPHTPLELRERPAARQGASSGMSLLSQGQSTEGGREREVGPERPHRCEVDFSRDCWSCRSSRHQSFDPCGSAGPMGFILPTEVHACTPPLAQSEHIGV